MTSTSYHRLAQQALGVAAAVVGLAFAGGAAAQPATSWQQALHTHSVALDHRYHLGRFAVPASAGKNTAPAWLRALELRGNAANAQYQLGSFAPHLLAQRSSRLYFHWRDAAIGAAFTAVLMLLLAAAGGVLSRRDHGRVSTSA